MKIKDYVWISNKNLLRRKARSILTILSIVIGATMITVMISMALGVKRALLQEIQNTGALTEITVRPAIEGSRGGPGIDESLTEVQDNTSSSESYNISLDDAKKIRAVDYIVDSIGSVYVSARSINLQGKEENWPVEISAIPIKKMAEVDLAAGRNFQKGDKEKIILGRIFIKTLGAGKAEDLIGQTLNIRQVIDNPGGEYMRKKFPQYFGGQPTESSWQMAMREYRKNPEYKDFKAEIVGINGSTFETRQSYIPLVWANEMYKYKYGQENFIQNNGYNSITVKVDKENNVDKASKAIQDLGFSTLSIKDMMQGILNIFKIISAVLGVFGGIALLVAMIGIVNTMIMSIYERTREIGVMRATGASAKNIYTLFTAEAASIGFWGGVLGVLLALSLQKALIFGMDRWVLSDLDASSDPVLALGSANLFTTPLWLILGVISLTVILGTLAGFFPARRAAKMNPVDALKFE